MLGPMNVGLEIPADYYAPVRQTSIFERARMRRAKTVSYTADGRLLLDGKPAEPDTPEEMWQDLIYRALLFRLLRYVKRDDLNVFFFHWNSAIANMIFWGTVKNEQSTILLRIHSDKSASLREPMRLYQYDEKGNDKVANVYITTIRIQDYKSDLQRRATR